MPEQIAPDAEPADLKSALIELRHAREEISRLRPFVNMVDQAQRDADSVAPSAPADRATVYREVADRLAADAEQGEKEGFTRIYRRSAAKQVRDWADEAQQPAPWLSDSARIGRTLIWTWADIGKGVYGQGYRAAQTEARALLTGQRDSNEKRQADTKIVAYRDPNNSRTLLCREHGPRYVGMVPVTAENLPDGGICTFGRLSSLECGADVLIEEQPTPEA